jgi:hypothetical protein
MEWFTIDSWVPNILNSIIGVRNWKFDAITCQRQMQNAGFVILLLLRNSPGRTIPIKIVTTGRAEPARGCHRRRGHKAVWGRGLVCCWAAGRQAWPLPRQFCQLLPSRVTVTGPGIHLYQQQTSPNNHSYPAPPSLPAKVFGRHSATTSTAAATEYTGFDSSPSDC